MCSREYASLNSTILTSSSLVHLHSYHYLVGWRKQITEIACKPEETEYHRQLHIWSGAAADKIQRLVCNIIDPVQAAHLQSLYHQRDTAFLDLFYKYFHGNSSDKLFSLLPWRHEFKHATRLVMIELIKNIYAAWWENDVSSALMPLSHIPNVASLSLFPSKKF